jgi:arylsulfatase A-like enzyme
VKIILISLDTLCAGHLSCYGHRFDTSPCIDEFSAGSVLFERCYATDVPTPPSYTAIFSGRFGIHSGIFGFQDPTTYRPGPPMIQQLLLREGYETCAISNLFYPCPWLWTGPGRNR